jgi:hypothetical protein
VAAVRRKKYVKKVTALWTQASVKLRSRKDCCCDLRAVTATLAKPHALASASTEQPAAPAAAVDW